MITRLYPNSTNRYDSVRDLIKRQKEGDPEVLEVMEEVLDYMAVALHNLITVFRPQKICIGGYLGLILSHGWMEKLWEKVDKLSHGVYPAEEHIICSKLSIYGVAFGCISWVRDHMIEYMFEEEEN